MYDFCALLGIIKLAYNQLCFLSCKAFFHDFENGPIGHFGEKLFSLKQKMENNNCIIMSSILGNKIT